MSAIKRASAVKLIREFLKVEPNVELEYFLEDSKEVEKLVRGVEMASFNHSLSFIEALMSIVQQICCGLISIGEACRGCMYRFPDIVV